MKKPIKQMEPPPYVPGTPPPPVQCVTAPTGDEGRVIHISPGEDFSPLMDWAIQQIAAGLEIASASAARRMAKEIEAKRGLRPLT
jgi:hypothetical protein